jgi:hypothetical protein
MERVRCVLVLWLVVLGCTTVRIKKNEATTGFALADYQTFGFYDVSTKPAERAYTHQVNLLKSAIQQQLSNKGLSYAAVNPDLWVNIGVVTREKVQTRQTDFRTDAPRYMGQRRYTWRSQEVEVGRYKEGTATVDLVDREMNALVWTGVMEAIIPRKEARLQKTIAAGIDKLFGEL